MAVPATPTNVTGLSGDGWAVLRWDLLPFTSPDRPVTYTISQYGFPMYEGLSGNSIYLPVSNGSLASFQVLAVNSQGSSSPATVSVSPSTNAPYKTLQMLIFEDIQAVVTQTISSLVSTAWPNLAKVVVHDDVMMNYWPPTPDQEGLQVVLGPGDQTEEEQRVTNGDSWTQSYSVGLSLAADALTFWLAHDTREGITDLHVLGEFIKDRIIWALRLDRQRGRLADNTRDFSVKPWALGDGTLVGYLISFQVRWRTNVNEPHRRG